MSCEHWLSAILYFVLCLMDLINFKMFLHLEITIKTILNGTHFKDTFYCALAGLPIHNKKANEITLVETVDRPMLFDHPYTLFH